MASELHGPCEAGANTNTLKTDFLKFCLLASRAGAIPEGWSWAGFLKRAASLVATAMPQPEALGKWGEAGIAGSMGLRPTASLIYGHSVAETTSKASVGAGKDAEEASKGTDSDRILDEVGGRGLWEQFVIDLHLTIHKSKQAGI